MLYEDLEKLSATLANKEEPLEDAKKKSIESKIDQLKVELKIREEQLDEDEDAEDINIDEINIDSDINPDKKV